MSLVVEEDEVLSLFTGQIGALRAVPIDGDESDFIPRLSPPIPHDGGAFLGVHGHVSDDFPIKSERRRAYGDALGFGRHLLFMKRGVNEG